MRPAVEEPAFSHTWTVKIQAYMQPARDKMIIEVIILIIFATIHIVWVLTGIA